MAKWNEEEKIKALTIAASSCIREAATETGIPEGTIKRWRSEQRTGPEKRTEPNRTPKKLVALQEQAVQKAVDEAGDYIKDRLMGLADALYSLAQKSITKVDISISDPEELPMELIERAVPHDRDGAAWVRSLVGVMAQSIDKAQLLTGKPTARPEVVNRRVYDITQRIINDQESTDLAEQLLRRAANSNTSPLCLDDN